MCIRDSYYTEQMEKLHQKQAEDVMQGGAVPDDEQIHNLLEKKAAGKELTEQENALLNIFCKMCIRDRTIIIQVLFWMQSILGRMFPVDIILILRSTGSVSYTHLDVYKRQPRSVCRIKQINRKQIKRYM